MIRIVATYPKISIIRVISKFNQIRGRVITILIIFIPPTEGKYIFQLQSGLSYRVVPTAHIVNI